MRIGIVCPSVSKARAQKFCDAAQTAADMGTNINAVLVANNAATQSLRDLWPSMVVAGLNGGFAESVNFGAAALGDVDWVVVANDDLSLTADDLRRVADILEEAQCDGSSIVVLSGERKRPFLTKLGVVGSLSLATSAWRLATRSMSSSPPVVKSETVGDFYYSFSLIAVSSALWNSLGGLSENFIFCFEDADFFRRASAQYPDAEVFWSDMGVQHQHSASTRGNLAVVLPAIAWSGSRYLMSLGMGPVAARLLAACSLVARGPFAMAQANRSDHFRGIYKAFSGLILNRKASLPAPYGEEQLSVLRKQVVVGTSGRLGARSGIGVMQRKLFPLLEERGLMVELGPDRDAHRSRVQRVSSFLRALFLIPSGADVFLAMAPPFPLVVRAPKVGVVHDLRWLHTRSRLGAMYRSWDLRRLVRNSRVIVCNSQTTASALTDWYPREIRTPIVVLPLGPGNYGGATGMGPVARINRSVLLIGGAAHKENLKAAQAIAAARPSWAVTVVGVGVGSEVRAVLEEALGRPACRWLDQPSDAELASLFRECQTFVLLSTSEGFGFPYLEAAAAGMAVVAVRQPLIDELFAGERVAVIGGGSVAEVARQLSIINPQAPAVSESWIERFDWSRGAETLGEILKGCAIGER